MLKLQRDQRAVLVDNNETNVLIMLGGMALFAGIITLMDLIGRRQERRKAEKK